MTLGEGPGAWDLGPNRAWFSILEALLVPTNHFSEGLLFRFGHRPTREQIAYQTSHLSTINVTS